MMGGSEQQVSSTNVFLWRISLSELYVPPNSFDWLVGLMAFKLNVNFCSV